MTSTARRRRRHDSRRPRLDVQVVAGDEPSAPVAAAGNPVIRTPSLGVVVESADLQSPFLLCQLDKLITADVFRRASHGGYCRTRRTSAAAASIESAVRGPGESVGDAG